jgi:dTDP-4-amino-4,6-dideoxygalactose transaminase
MAVPYFRFEVTDAERAAVDEVLRSGWLTTGKQCFAFEQEFGEALGGGVDSIAVNSNTAGMHLVLEALGIGPGDEVIVPSLTFTATAEVVRYLGADVVLVDVDSETLNISPKTIEAALTPRTKAIMVVHYGGLAADMPAITAIAKKHGCHVVEDAAHSFPASLNTVPIGKTGAAASVFSFYANKTIITGEGGMIVTSDPALAKRCRVMRLHGIDRDAFQRFTGKSAQWRYDVVAPGFKYNLTDIAAALGREQLKFAEQNRLLRQKVAESYQSAFSDLPLKLPVHGGKNTHAWHLYPVQFLASSGVIRDHAEAVLTERGVGYSMHYTPLHRLTYWKEQYTLDDRSFPVASRHGETSLSLPIFSAMKKQEVEEVILAVRAIFGV